MQVGRQVYKYMVEISAKSGVVNYSSHRPFKQHTIIILHKKKFTKLISFRIFIFFKVNL